MDRIILTVSVLFDRSTGVFSAAASFCSIIEASPLKDREEAPHGHH
jgi:hypothetical protein